MVGTAAVEGTPAKVPEAGEHGGNLTNQGVFLPLPAIINKEGGMQIRSNVVAALTYCKKCIQLDALGKAAHQWTMWNPMTDRPEFRYIKYMDTDKMTHLWEMGIDFVGPKPSQKRRATGQPDTGPKGKRGKPSAMLEDVAGGGQEDKDKCPSS